jgi:hypothetical protein
LSPTCQNEGGPPFAAVRSEFAPILQENVIRGLSFPELPGTIPKGQTRAARKTARIAVILDIGALVRQLVLLTWREWQHTLTNNNYQVRHTERTDELQGRSRRF